MPQSPNAPRLTAGVAAAAMVLTSLLPSMAAAQYRPANPEPSRVTQVEPLTVFTMPYVPQTGIDSSSLRSCFSAMDLRSLNQGLIVPDDTELMIRAEANYRQAIYALEHAKPEDQKAAKARADEAERYLADVQEAMRRGEGAPIRQIVEAKAMDRNAEDGVDGIYTPSEYKDLRLTNVVVTPAQVRGQPVLHITGRIINPRGGSISVPPLWFAAIDGQGETLKTQQAVAQRPTRIAARGSAPFTFDLPAPGGAQKAAVTFAPQNRAPRVQPYDETCGDSTMGGFSTVAGQFRSGTGGAGRAR